MLISACWTLTNPRRGYQSSAASSSTTDSFSSSGTGDGLPVGGCSNHEQCHVLCSSSCPPAVVRLPTHPPSTTENQFISNACSPALVSTLILQCEPTRPIRQCVYALVCPAPSLRFPPASPALPVSCGAPAHAVASALPVCGWHSPNQASHPLVCISTLTAHAANRVGEAEQPSTF